MNRNEVADAFDVLLEEIDRAISDLNRAGAEAFQLGKYDLAKKMTERGERIKELRTKVADLRKEWNKIFAGGRSSRVQKETKFEKARLRAGLKTPDREFRIPILRSLVDLGGSAPMSKVLDRVGEIMKHRLNEFDQMTLPSDPRQIRWRNTAQWERFAMVREGLLASDSPRGIWEITPAGRRLLASTIGRRSSDKIT